MDFKAEAAQIVDALLNDNQAIPMPYKPGTSRRKEEKPKFKPVGRDPYFPSHMLPRCRNCGSRNHSTQDCPQHGTHII